MNSMTIPRPAAAEARFPHEDGSRVPYKVFNSPEVYAREQERIFRGPTWSFLGLEAEIPNPGDFKSTFIGDTPVVMTRAEDGTLCAWVNRCAHRGAAVCRVPRGNAVAHTCVYHQWNYTAKGDLQGVPFRRGRNDMTGMPKDFKPAEHGLRKLRVDSYHGLVFATFSETVAPLPDYIGPQMRPWVDRIFHKPIVYLGCTRQYSNSNWKLYLENVKDPYHASLLHLFHTTFNIFRVNMEARTACDDTGLHSVLLAIKQDDTGADDYTAQNIRSFDAGFKLEDDSVLAMVKEYEELATNHIQPIFPQLVIQQIHNTLVARQILPKGPDHFELVFHYFGYEDDTPEMRALRVMQANLVGPAGYISMEDTEATELVQAGIEGQGSEAMSVLEMSRSAPDQRNTLISESMVRRFWVGYQTLMGFEAGAGGGGVTLSPDLLLRLEMQDFQDRYMAAIDEDRLEEWPGFFVEDCLYEIIPRENADAGLPIPLVYCNNAAMLRDRVISLRHANIYSQPRYRHFVSGLSCRMAGEDQVEMSSSYLVVNTTISGVSEVYQAGRYQDVVLRTQDGWKLKSRRAIYDTSRVQTLLAYPI